MSSAPNGRREKEISAVRSKLKEILITIFIIFTQFGNEDYDYTNYDDKRINDRRQYDQRRNNYNFHGSNRRLKLIWDEKGRSLEYTLRVDQSRRGFWLTSGPQKGLLAIFCLSSFQIFITKII
jgi:hypothetical protein